MIRNDEIQTALVSKLKANANVIALVSATEIREDQWQGNSFVYPNVRVRMITNIPADKGCLQNFTVSFMALTEDSFSDVADKIAGIIGNEFHDSSFITSGLEISLTVTDVLPAFRSDVRTWRSECVCKGTVCRA
jgi:hypothetical protein